MTTLTDDPTINVTNTAATDNVIKSKKKAKSKSQTHISFLRKKLTKYSDEILVNTSMVFIPAEIHTTSHHDTKDICWEFNPTTLVTIINGEGKHLHFNTNPGTPEQEAQFVDLDELWEKAHGETCPNGEIHDKIANAINNDTRFKGVDKQSRRPIVITGRKLISMGATLVSPKTGPWTHAIVHGTGSDKGFHDLTTRERAALSQLFGRLNGRKDPKDWGEWFVNGGVPKTVVYAPAVVKDIVLSAEKVNRYYADQATVEGAAGSSAAHASQPARAVINRDEYRTKMVQEYEERKKMRAPTRAEREAAEKDEKKQVKQREAAKKAERAIERLAKAEANAKAKADKEAEKEAKAKAKAEKDAEKEAKAKAKAEKEAERENDETGPQGTVSKDDVIIAGLLTQGEYDRLTHVRFPWWATKAKDGVKIANFMKLPELNTNQEYTITELRQMCKNCGIGNMKDLLEYDKSKSKRYGTIFHKNETNNTYKIYDALADSYNTHFKSQ